MDITDLIKIDNNRIINIDDNYYYLGVFEYNIDFGFSLLENAIRVISEDEDIIMGIQINEINDVGFKMYFLYSYIEHFNYKTTSLTLNPSIAIRNENYIKSFSLNKKMDQMLLDKYNIINIKSGEFRLTTYGNKTFINVFAIPVKDFSNSVMELSNIF